MSIRTTNQSKTISAAVPKSLVESKWHFADNYFGKVPLNHHSASLENIFWMHACKFDFGLICNVGISKNCFDKRYSKAEWVENVETTWVRKNCTFLCIVIQNSNSHIRFEFAFKFYIRIPLNQVILKCANRALWEEKKNFIERYCMLKSKVNLSEQGALNIFKAFYNKFQI